jgi:multisubunit Na+/H+ antiporter MnhG subunit
VNWRIFVATVLLIAGGGIELLAVLGLCAMRATYDRLHYLGLVSYGALLIAVAIVFRESFSLIGDKALLVGAVLVVSGAVLTHVTLRSLLMRERGDWRTAIEPANEEREQR